MNCRRKVFITALLVWYVIFSISMAITPADRQFWLAANILPVIFVATLVVTHRLFPLSNGSYLLITVFLTLHTIGVHYTYAQAPFGDWLQQALHLNRNHFDRIVHFFFGCLLAYPLEEWFRLFARVRGWLLYYLPIITILGLSGLWEILGSQGDVWDAQKDMSAALYGSILCMVLIILIRKLGNRTSAVIPNTASSVIAGTSRSLEESS